MCNYYLNPRRNKWKIVQFYNDCSICTTLYLYVNTNFTLLRLFPFCRMSMICCVRSCTKLARSSKKKKKGKSRLKRVI